MKVATKMPAQTTEDNLNRIEATLIALDAKVDAMIERVTEAIDKLEETITILETERRVDWYGGDMN